jgi:DeoR family glycerol-3-phosphate regulon repressor
MQTSRRHLEILELARDHGRVSVDELAARYHVTPQTIRKDLNTLCESRQLARVHGGAVLPSGTENVRYEQRRNIASREKTSIGQAAARLIPDNASLFINIGTTTEAVSEALVDHSGLMVITNNIYVANRLRVYPQFEVIIAGGVVRGSDGGIVGEAAVDFIRQFKVDYAIIGTSAIDDDGSLYDFDFREVKVAQAIIQHARHVMLVADSSKFERTAPVRVGHVSQIHSFITNRCANPNVLSLCREHGVRVLQTFDDA